MRLRMTFFSMLGAACVIVALAAGGARAEVRQAPASRVALDLPAGYAPSRYFTGFINESAGISLVIVELPRAAYEQLAAGLTTDALAAKGIAQAQPARLDRADHYLFIRGVQASAQGPVAKFIIAFHGHGMSALITANVQEDALERGAAKAEDVERILASASIAPNAAPAQDIFQLGYLGPFKLAGSILGNTRAFTLDGRMEASAQAGQRAMLIVAPSLDRRSVPDGAAAAETLLNSLPGLERIAIAQRNETSIAGMRAIEVVGAAVDKGGREVALWQVLVLPEAGGYYRLVGQMPASERETLLPELRKIAASFKPID